MNELRYYIHDNTVAFRFQLIGRLTSKTGTDLGQAWQTSFSVIGSRPVHLDLSGLTGVDPSGKELLEDWIKRGGQLVVTSTRAQERVRAMTTLPATLLPGRAEQKARRRRLVLRLALFFQLLSPACAASLAPATIHAWEQYILATRLDTHARASTAGCFLWAEATPERLASVRAGETLVSPAERRFPRKIESGLIHHWIGAVFIPGAALNQVLPVLRDYKRYKDYYRPAVLKSTPLVVTEAEDQFTMLLSNPSLFRKSALERQYKSVWIPVDHHRLYSVTQTTQIKEIAGFETSNPRTLPVGTGTGLIWRMFSMIRLEERKEGVFIEVEAVVLSRDIPATLGWLIEPIVRRTARSALTLSLQQTRDAIRASMAVSARR